jgi:hypothetical protein
VADELNEPVFQHFGGEFVESRCDLTNTPSTRCLGQRDGLGNRDAAEQNGSLLPRI